MNISKRTLVKGLLGAAALLASLGTAGASYAQDVNLLWVQAMKDHPVHRLMQAGFLAYGVWIMTQSRPVFIVAVADRFEVVFANELAPEDLAKARDPQFARLGFGAPRVIGGRLGETGQERLDLALSGFAGKDIHLLPERYTQFDEVRATILSAAKPASELAAASAAAANAIEGVSRDTGIAVADLVYVPIMSSRGRATMLLEREDGEIVGPVAVNPWPDLEAAAP